MFCYEVFIDRGFIEGVMSNIIYNFGFKMSMCIIFFFVDLKYEDVSLKYKK